MGEGVVRGVEPGSLSPRLHRPCTGVPGVLGGTADQGGVVQVNLLLNEIAGLGTDRRRGGPVRVTPGL